MSDSEIMSIKDTSKNNNYSNTIQQASSIIHVAMRSAQELTHLVAEVHSTINALPSPFNKHHQPSAKYAPFPYKIVSTAFSLLAKLSHILAPQSTEFNNPLAVRSQAAFNGVSGDKLEFWDSPLAIPLSLRGENGDFLDVASWATDPAKGHVIFLHGLCESDLDWQRGQHHQDFYHQLAQSGYKVAWLRYNTGRAIHHNGEEFAELLQNHFANKGKSVMLIGHSMGGLVIRSAMDWAEKQQHTWLSRISHAAYLGTPHLGAPLERLGNKANNLLNITPYTRPFMRLGNIRSRGIKDLRYARITEDNIVPHLPEHIEHLLVASTWKSEYDYDVVGDGLVPMSSALAQDDQGDVLFAPKVTRVTLNDMSHIAMLSDERIYQQLRQWLKLFV